MYTAGSNHHWWRNWKRLLITNDRFSRHRQVAHSKPRFPVPYSSLEEGWRKPVLACTHSKLRFPAPYSSLEEGWRKPELACTHSKPRFPAPSSSLKKGDSKSRSRGHRGHSHSRGSEIEGPVTWRKSMGMCCRHPTPSADVELSCCTGNSTRAISVRPTHGNKHW